MSNARELALLGNWSNAATILPPLSPTSPKATKFCCCPNRRRYNLKQPKLKTTLHVRNIFVDNDFAFIDDAAGGAGAGGATAADANADAEPRTATGRNDTTTTEATHVTDKRVTADDQGHESSVVVVVKYKTQIQPQQRDSRFHDYDDVTEVGSPGGNCVKTAAAAETRDGSEVGAGEENRENQREWRRDRSGHTNSSNNTASQIQDDRDDNNDDNDEGDDDDDGDDGDGCNTKTAKFAYNTAHHQQRRRQHGGETTVTKRSTQSGHVARIAGNVTEAATVKCENDLKGPAPNDSAASSNQPIQRLRNSNNSDNKRNSACKDNSSGTEAEDSCKSCFKPLSLNCCCQRVQPQQQNHIDKMTITTTATATQSATATVPGGHVADRKPSRSECGLTLQQRPLTPATATSRQSPVSPTSPTSPVRPTTTVIKTTMVKRSPANETASTPSPTPTPTPTPIATATPTSAATAPPATAATTRNCNRTNGATGVATGNRPATNSPAPALSVKERIAAFAAGSEQPQRTPDRLARPNGRAPCNTANQQSNMTTTTTTTTTATATSTAVAGTGATSAINSLQHNQAESGDNICQKSGDGAATAVTATPDAIRAPSSSASCARAYFDDTATGRHKSSTMLRSSAPGCAATVPRCRTSAANNGSGSGSSSNGSIAGTGHKKCGSNATTATAGATATTLDINTSSVSTPSHRPRHNDGSTSAVDKANNGLLAAAAAAAAAGCGHKLAALDNLDLALNLPDLTLDGDEEDDEDPYFALQAYLERVKHEINEVFELHKARQRLQQLQESDTNAVATPAAAALNAAVSSDELSRSTESDSGFDSASGGHGAGHIGGSTESCAGGSTSVANKLPATSNVAAPDAAAAGGRLREITGAQLTGSTSSASTQSATRSTSADVVDGHGVSGQQSLVARAPQEDPTSPTTTELRALPPPPLSPLPPAPGPDGAGKGNGDGDGDGLSPMPKGARGGRKGAEATADDVNMWANKFLRDLDNLMASDKPPTTTTTATMRTRSSSTTATTIATATGTTTTSSSASSSPSPTSTTAPVLLSAAATAAIQSRYGKGAHERSCDHTGGTSAAAAAAAAANGVVLRPEKHTTIPLQSFNLDCGRLDSGATTAAPVAAPVAGAGGGDGGGSATKTNIVYMRTLSAPSPPTTANCNQQQREQQSPFNEKKATCGSRQVQQRNSPVAFNASSEQHQDLTNFQSNNAANGAISSNSAPPPPPPTPTTVLKIEETATGRRQAAPVAGSPASASACAPSAAPSMRQLQLDRDMDAIRTTSLDQSQRLSSLMQQNHYCDHNNSNKNKSVCEKNITPTPTPMSKRTVNGLNHAIIAPSTPPAKPPPLPASATGGYLQHGSDAAKKGSTSTIWTSEESILRSVGAVDEDNNSTSSSACEEASGVLSSGKSGISLDSSGFDNDNNESGIGTATPPKDVSFWKSSPPHHSHHHHHHRHHHHHHRHHHHQQQQQQQPDNESLSSLEALRKMKFHKGGSVASSDDPDLLEVLSLCDETHDDEDEDDDEEDDDDDDVGVSIAGKSEGRQHQPRPHSPSQQQLQQRRRQRRLQQQPENRSGAAVEAGEEAAEELVGDYDLLDELNEGHDEFETMPYCDCECADGDASSAGSGGSAVTAHSKVTPSDSSAMEGGGVVLRRKYAASPITVPCGGRIHKCRSHSLPLDTASLPNSYSNHLHQQQQQQQQHHINGHVPFHPHHPHAHLARKLHHLRDRHKERAQLSLTLRQEPFQPLLSPTHFNELPSPSSASLHSGHDMLDTKELSTKSNSAPLLLKQERRRDDFAAPNVVLRYSRSQSDRYLAEIEAVEACKWLRAAGFPQYAQMYEDHQFPIDLSNVAKDHTNLEHDQLQSLYRRLCVLNRCANMRLDQSHKTQTPRKEDSDDENFALSENWTFQPHIRRWSRIGEMGLELPPAGKLAAEKAESSSKESSPDRFEDDTYDVAGTGLSLTLPGTGASDTGGEQVANDAADTCMSPLRRTGSERFKDGAKAFLRRVESIKSRRRKRQNREGIVISGPQALDLSQLAERNSLRKPDAVYSTPPSPSAVSPMHIYPKSPFGFGNELKVPSHSENFLSPNRISPKRAPTTPRSMRASPLHFFTNPMPHLKEGKSDDSSSYYSDSQESSAAVAKSSLRKTPSKTRRFLQRTGKVDDIGAHSDSECHQGRKLLIKDANSNTTEIKIKKLSRGGSLNLGRDAKKREGVRSASFRSRSTTRKEPKLEEAEIMKKTPVVRWHSFQMEERPHMIFRKCCSQRKDLNSGDQGLPFAAMSAGQLQILRKLALVVLTGYMERYCPTHRSGWNWELPKFIKKIKMPDYKDKKVFGVPLLLVLQRTGQTLPIAVRAAFRWLQLNALDQIGLFRKSGVKSRIIKLKELIEFSESTSECMDVFDTQQAYDVADMLKQYFRDLPESLLTTKMSETFAAIFQHLPNEVRLDAVQCAVLLLPDENREALYALLEFLTLVAANSQYNQMTTNNLAVCFAPSLFHSSISTGTGPVTASPRRRGKGSGVPDAKELFEAKASHECLAFMIENYRQIYTAPKEKISRCNFGYMEESKPLPLEALGEGMQFHNWRGYLYESTSATIKEGREKSRGWITIASQTDAHVDIAYKKVGDGHPLRLWRCITEVEGPPKDVLDYIIKQRASWDPNLLQSQTIKTLDDCTEIFQYALDGQTTTDFCVLRSWRTDLPRGACVIVETSIDHNKAKPMFGAVRGVVLASRYLIEPCGSGRSRVMHLARVDVKGKTPEWYNKSYGHIASHYLARIRLAFKNVSDGPESKV